MVSIVGPPDRFLSFAEIGDADILDCCQPHPDEWYKRGIGHRCNIQVLFDRMESQWKSAAGDTELPGR